MQKEKVQNFTEQQKKTNKEMEKLLQENGEQIELFKNGEKVGLPTQISQEELGISAIMKGIPSFVDISKKSLLSKFLPHFFIYHEDKKHMVLRGLSSEDMEMPVGIKIKHVVSLECVRQLRGKTYENRMKRPDPGNEKAMKEWGVRVEKAEKREEGWQLGTTNLIVILMPDGTCTCAGMETYDSTESYMLELFKASTQKGMIAKINIKWHIENDVLSKKTGFPYLSGYKFNKGNQWEIIPLEEKEVIQIKETYEAQKEQIKFFLSE